MKALIDIPVDINQSLNIIKAKKNLKNKVEAISLVVEYYVKNELEPELRPDFVKKIEKGDKNYKLGTGFKFNKVNDIKKKYNLD